MLPHVHGLVIVPLILIGIVVMAPGGHVVAVGGARTKLLRVGFLGVFPVGPLQGVLRPHVVVESPWARARGVVKVIETVGGAVVWQRLGRH